MSEAYPQEYKERKDLLDNNTDLDGQMDRFIASSQQNLENRERERIDETF
jgi:hypothetical protein